MLLLCSCRSLIYPRNLVITIKVKRSWCLIVIRKNLIANILEMHKGFSFLREFIMKNLNIDAIKETVKKI